MNEHDDRLWARRPRDRHADLYDVEYAKQLERIARIRNEVSASLEGEEAAPERETASGDVGVAGGGAAPDREAAQGRDAAPGHAGAPGGAAEPRRHAAPGHAGAPGGAAEPRRDAAPGHAAVRPLASPPPSSSEAAGRAGTTRWDAAPGGFVPAAPAATAAQARREAPPATAGVARREAPPAAAAVARREAPPHSRPPAPPAVHGARRRLVVVPLPPTPAPEEPSDPVSPRRRTRWLFAAVVLTLLLGGAVAVLATRSPGAPAATVFRVPGVPTGVVAAGGEVWVAGPAAGAVWVLDAASGKAAAPTLRPGGTPARLALEGRFAWIADTERSSVIRAPRAGKGALRSIRTGPDVADVIVAAGTVWTASSADGTVRAIGPGDRREVLHVGVRPIALAGDARRVLVLDAAGQLIRLDAMTRRQQDAPVALGGVPVDVALEGDFAWVADADAGSVRAVALATGRASSPVAVGREPVAIAADAGGVYVLCRGDRTLVRLDLDGHIRSRLHLQQAPTALALDSRHVWIAAGSNEVIRVDR